MLRNALIAVTVFMLTAAPVFGDDAAEIARLKVANAAFDAALSKRDLAALDVIWARDAGVTALHPPSKQARARGLRDLSEAAEGLARPSGQAGPSAPGCAPTSDRA